MTPAKRVSMQGSDLHQQGEEWEAKHGRAQCSGQQGKPQTALHMAAVSKAMTGKPKTAAHKAAISKAQKGKSPYNKGAKAHIKGQSTINFHKQVKHH